MATILRLFCFFLLAISSASAEDENQFVYNGFLGANLSMDHLAKILSNGLLQLTNTSAQQMGHAFHQQPLKFNSTNYSFSTYFVFAIVPGSDNGNGLAFVIARSKDFNHADATQYLGLFNISTNGLSTNHVLAVEFDTVLSAEFDDIDNNHVGIDINSLISTYSATASYFSEKKVKKKISLISGDPIQVWIDYDAAERLLNITLAPNRTPKPNMPLLSSHVNISDIFSDTMYVGFSAATGSLTSAHYILGWSFNTSGKAQTLRYSDLPKLPPRKSQRRLTIIISVLLSFVVLLIALTIAAYLYRRKYRELQEWEKAYGPQMFSYKNVHKATKGFSNTELLGAGGFGNVFRGTLGVNQQIAVKRVSHNIEHRMKQFVAEIVSMRRLRHKNLVQLLGYCRRKGELLLVYEYMPNGSLDSFLFTRNKPNLTWSQRFQIIKDVASAVLYLHEEWEQVVLHRDIKASNVLLDDNLNGRLGDFGLARLYDRGSNPEPTQLVGTPGYLAPELTKTSKATVSTDVFGFGVFLLEVVCGRRPIEHQGLPEEQNLIDWVIICWKQNTLLDVVDPRLESLYVAKEVELILKLGLVCTHCIPDFRPGMGQVMQYLEGDVDLLDIQLDQSGIDMLTGAHQTLGFPLSISPSHEEICTPQISSTVGTTDQTFCLSQEENCSPLVTSITVSIGSTDR
ncbi:hypothetical protein ACFE04_013296 [Oxalis oulophora]